MKHESLRAKVLGLLSVMLVATLVARSGMGQESGQKPDPDPPKEEKAEPSQDAAVEKPGEPSIDIDDPKERKRLKVRLPTYYSRVVTDEQRDRIYTIQAKFNSQILKLNDQLKSLTTKRDAEVEKVLTEEQRAEIASLWEERRASRKKTSGKEE